MLVGLFFLFISNQISILTYFPVDWFEMDFFLFVLKILWWIQHTVYHTFRWRLKKKKRKREKNMQIFIMKAKDLRLTFTRFASNAAYLFLFFWINDDEKSEIRSFRTFHCIRYGGSKYAYKVCLPYIAHQFISIQYTFYSVEVTSSDRYQMCIAHTIWFRSPHLL